MSYRLLLFHHIFFDASLSPSHHILALLMPTGTTGQPHSLIPKGVAPDASPCHSLARVDLPTNAITFQNNSCRQTDTNETAFP